MESDHEKKFIPKSIRKMPSGRRSAMIERQLELDVSSLRTNRIKNDLYPGKKKG